MKYFILLFFTKVVAFSQIATDVSCKIIIEKKDNFIILRANTNNNGPLTIGNLSYNFIALKKDKNNTYSNNKQSGTFSIKPNEEKILAEIRINLNDKEELRSFLFIKHKEKTLITKDSLYFSKEITKQRGHPKEKSFVLKGVVVDEAITKIGKDFHDIFYQYYLLSGYKHPFLLKIKEKPGLGRSSIISVLAEDLKIHEFIAKPEEEYLQQNAKFILARINMYAKRRNVLLKASKI